MDVAMNIDPKFKMINGDKGRIEKWVLRRDFDDEEHPYLPKHILYRQKEQFRNKVGYSLIDGLKAHASTLVTDKILQNAWFIYPHNTPTSKEAYHYRVIFERLFPQNSARLTVPQEQSIAWSTTKVVEWDAEWSNNLDPSRRTALGEPKLIADDATVNGKPSQAKIKKSRIDNAIHSTTVIVGT
ncbi:hypothetical protein ZOSMA_72G00330 [Zostera marina]|uniref:Asparagine synthetase domain-containing protein n=1 Tax=Zostera marina TaxID=29655 RepID=A0A0K9NQ25_ZOSMR|nr:hypothetical protein ZOSMA_72G00330 [Zostera marina]